MKIYRITTAGMNSVIEQFCALTGRNSNQIAKNRFSDYCFQLEEKISDGRTFAEIEVSQHYTISGAPEFISIGEADFDVEEIDE